MNSSGNILDNLVGKVNLVTDVGDECYSSLDSWRPVSGFAMQGGPGPLQAHWGPLQAHRAPSQVHRAPGRLMGASAGT